MPADQLSLHSARKWEELIGWLDPDRSVIIVGGGDLPVSPLSFSPSFFSLSCCHLFLSEGGPIAKVEIVRRNVYDTQIIVLVERTQPSCSCLRSYGNVIGLIGIFPPSTIEGEWELYPLGNKTWDFKWNIWLRFGRTLDVRHNGLYDAVNHLIRYTPNCPNWIIAVSQIRPSICMQLS